MSEEQRSDSEEIKRSLIATYAADTFNAFDQFTTTLAELNRRWYDAIKRVDEPLPPLCTAPVER